MSVAGRTDGRSKIEQYSGRPDIATTVDAIAIFTPLAVFWKSISDLHNFLEFYSEGIQICVRSPYHYISLCLNFFTYLCQISQSQIQRLM